MQHASLVTIAHSDDYSVCSKTTYLDINVARLYPAASKVFASPYSPATTIPSSLLQSLHVRCLKTPLAVSSFKPSTSTPNAHDSACDSKQEAWCDGFHPQ